VDVVCEHTGWPVGHAYIRAPGSGDLVPSSVWHIDGAGEFEKLRRVTERVTLSNGVGLPGRVLATGEAAWITDVTRDPNFPRQNVEGRLGVRGAFAFPVAVAGEIEAVLEYFTPSPVASDEALLQTVGQIGRHLGRVIERIRAQEQVAHQAMHDALTGLPNRLLLRDRLELALGRAERRRSFAAVFFLDLDGFGDISNRLGQSAAEQLLKAVAARLNSTLLSSDMLARFGSDKFAILCQDLVHGGEAENMAGRVQRALAVPFDVEGEEHVVTASIGIAVTSGVRSDPERLIEDAQAAMRRARERGRGHWELFK
jgi:diguanylate cyclase (GGDEF)-like protein